MELRVRPATPADVPTLVALMTTFHAESGYPLPGAAAARAFAALLADARLGGAWLAEAAGSDAGHLLLACALASPVHATAASALEDPPCRSVRPSAAVAEVHDTLRAGLAVERQLTGRG